MEIQQLLRPFPQEAIRTRKGRKNMYYDYIPSHLIINRLNECSANWSFSVKDRIVEETEVAVLGSLTIGSITKEAWGSSLREGKSLGDALKSSSSLSLTKCCSLLGMNVVFTQNSTGGQVQQNYTPQQQNTPALPVQNQEAPFPHGCQDCGVVISDAEVQFSRKYPQTYNRKDLCRDCQQQYRHSQNQQQMRRVK